MSVDSPGFATARANAVKIEVDRSVRIDFRMILAGKQEKIVVHGRAPDLNTESGELASVIDQSRIDSLPLNQRDFLQLSLLTPGVAPPVQDSELSSRGTFAMHANGGREEANNYLLDGVDNNDSDNGAYVLQPSVDTIQEFKIATNSYSAEYGKASGGQVNVVTRSGTNEAHGSIYDYLRNRDLDARNFFDGSVRPEYIRNQFGAGVGGPIRENRTFFYGNFEGLRERQGLTQLGTVPSSAVRNGDLSSLGVAVHNPYSSQPFAGDIIPGSLISPNAKQVMALFPQANLPGIGGNYLSAPVATGDQNEGSGRVDHWVSESSELNIRYSYGRRDLFEPFAEDRTRTSGLWRLRSRQRTQCNDSLPTDLWTQRNKLRHFGTESGCAADPGTESRHLSQQLVGSKLLTCRVPRLWLPGNFSYRILAGGRRRITADRPRG